MFCSWVVNYIKLFKWISPQVIKWWFLIFFLSFPSKLNALLWSILSLTHTLFKRLLKRMHSNVYHIFLIPLCCRRAVISLWSENRRVEPPLPCSPSLRPGWDKFSEKLFPVPKRLCSFDLRHSPQWSASSTLLIGLCRALNFSIWWMLF